MVVVLYSKVSVQREDERAEIRWKLWLREKVILVWARLMEDIKVGEIVGKVRSETCRVLVWYSIVFRFEFSGLIKAWHDYRCTTP